MAMDLEQMKQKYASVLTMIQQQEVRLSHVHIQDNKLFIQGVAPSDQAKNNVWDQIKLVNPNWSQELTADITVDPAAQSTQSSAGATAGRTYTVQAGDSLSKISKQFYGNANDYMKIFEANRDVLSDPNKINPGQTLKIPA
ncbi:MAG: LysM peptidoglycan-binding domain-containing protein [Bryobacterales bacterium]|nr:LysM peptidoglycan-binding domain-containing protein [Bryobacterales bacterium]MBV9397746.1 LysM peptidoglycan-binding domain-containing protein [Bryobacterales bacterium]